MCSPDETRLTTSSSLMNRNATTRHGSSPVSIPKWMRQQRRVPWASRRRRRRVQRLRHRQKVAVGAAEGSNARPMRLPKSKPSHAGARAQRQYVQQRAVYDQWIESFKRAFSACLDSRGFGQVICSRTRVSLRFAVLTLQQFYYPRAVSQGHALVSLPLSDNPDRF
jgi:hypothetical protein